MKQGLLESLGEIPSLEPILNKLDDATSMSGLVLAAWHLGRSLAILALQEHLSRSAKQPTHWPLCPVCGARLQSKGLRPRVLFTLLGWVRWKRRVGRCRNKCRIGQVASLDDALGLAPHQETSNEVKKVTCALAVFLPFAVAAQFLAMLTGAPVSASSVWNWVQEAGRREMKWLEHRLQQLAQGQRPDEEALAPATAALPLLMGADGVMAPFRPQTGTPAGKTVWREVKVGIFARLSQRVTRTGKVAPCLLQRRLVAVLGTVDAFAPRLLLEAHRQGLRSAPQVVWLSDGGRWLWGIFSASLSSHATGILDFYHAAQNLWKAAAACLDGRTKSAREWFQAARHQLRHNNPDGVLEDIEKALLLQGLPKSAAKALQNLHHYLAIHRDHIDYAKFKELGLPIGSGLVESACKWLIQQRFKGVGMRWSEKGFNHLLHLRLAWVNSRFDALFPCCQASPNV